MRHLSDRQILDTQFRLATEHAARRVAEHLAACGACRQRDEQLRRKFTSLNALRESAPASEQLVAETLRRIRQAQPEPRAAVPWLSWVWGAAAVAAVLLAIVYVGPLLTRPPGVGAVAMRKPAEAAADREAPAPAEPVMEVALLRDEEYAAEALLEKEEVAAADQLNAPKSMELAQLARGGAAAPEDKLQQEPVPTEGVKAGALMLGVEQTRGLAVAGRPPAASAFREDFRARKTAALPEPEVPWTWETPTQVQVVVRSALAGFDKDTLQVIERTGRPARQWRITVVNTGDEAAVVRLTRSFPSADWAVRVADGQVSLTTQALNRAVLSVDVPPAEELSFICTVIAGPDGGP